MTMKLSVLALVLASAAMSSHAQVNDKTLQLADKKTHAPVRGGVYEIMPNLQAVAAKDVQNSDVISTVGTHSIVEKPIASARATADKIQAGTVVKNRFTGEFGVYSGKILVLAKPGVDIATIQQKFGLTVAKSTGDASLVLFKSNNNQDLKQLQAQLKASGLVESARLDMLERRNVTY